MVEVVKLQAASLRLDVTKYPFSSPMFDPDVTDGAQIQDLLDNAIPYSATTSLDYFDVVDGRGALYKDLKLDGSEAEAHVLTPKTKKIREFRVFFNRQDVSRRVPISLTQQGLIKLFEDHAIPPRYLEVLVNNNGVENAITTYGTNGTIPDAFHLFLKLPTSSALNAAIYFRHNLTSKTTECFIFGDSQQKLQERLQHIFPDSESPLPARNGKDPFIILSTIFAHFSTVLEYERRRLDVLVREQEAKTGMGAHMYDTSLRASAQQYSGLVRALHDLEGQLMFLNRSIEFQVSCTKFLLEQHTVLNELRSKVLWRESHETRDDSALNIGELQKVHDSLSLSASFEYNRYCQIKTLIKRVQIQLSVVANLVAQNDSKTSILISEQSSNLSAAAARDSSVMKSIAVVTMLFLPGTFVSTLFAMPFFHVGAEDEVKLVVDSQWWLYLAVTLPVTLLVFLLWGAWSKIKDKTQKGDLISETPPLKV